MQRLRPRFRPHQQLLMQSGGFELLGDLFSWDERTDGTLTDSVSGATSQFKDFPVGGFDGTDLLIGNTDIKSALIAGTKVRMKLKFTFDSNSIGFDNFVTNIGNRNYAANLGYEGMGIRKLGSNLIYFYLCSGANGVVVQDTSIVAVADTEYEADLIWNYVAGTYDVTIGGINFTGSTNAVDFNNLLYTFAIGGNGDPGRSKHNGNIHSWQLFIDDILFREYKDVYSGVDTSGNNDNLTTTSIIKAYSDDMLHLLNYGFTQYYDVSGNSLQIPYDDNGQPVYTASTYTHNGTVYSKATTSPEHPGGQIYNACECNWEPVVTGAEFDIFDKSNATIFKQAIRDAIYYDVANPYKWYAPVELDCLYNIEMTELDYRGLWFFVWLNTQDDKVLLTSMQCFTVAPTGQASIDSYLACNASDHMVIDETGQYVYDEVTGQAIIELTI